MWVPVQTGSSSIALRPHHVCTHFYLQRAAAEKRAKEKCGTSPTVLSGQNLALLVVTLLLVASASVFWRVFPLKISGSMNKVYITKKNSLLLSQCRWQQGQVGQPDMCITELRTWTMGLLHYWAFLFLICLTQCITWP